jgi:hypothetical protein
LVRLADGVKEGNNTTVMKMKTIAYATWRRSCMPFVLASFKVPIISERWWLEVAPATSPRKEEEEEFTHK